MPVNVLVLFAIVMLYAFYRSKYERYQCIDLIFVGIWVLFSIEYYATTDYPVYYENFDRIHVHAIWEPGYRLLLLMFQPFGFFVFNSVVSAFEMFTLCYMFKKFCPPKYIWFGVLLFMVDIDNMMALMCLKRQFFAMAIGLWTLYFTCWSTSRYRWVYAGLTFLASMLIHTSAVATALYFVVPFIRVRFNPVASVAVVLLFLWSLTFDMTNYIDELMQIYDFASGDNISSGRYSQYVEELDIVSIGNVISKAGWFMAISYVISFVVLLFFNRKMTDRQYHLLLFALLSYILGNIFVNEFYRLNLYYSITLWFIIPVVLKYLVAESRTGGYLILKRSAMWLCMALWFIGPVRSYFNAFTGTKVSYMTMRFKHFPTIFDENVDKSVYLFDNTIEVE